MRKECSLYYLAFACFGMFGASQSKQASKTQQQWNIEALSKGATHIGEDRVGHSLDTSLLPCRLQQHNVQCSTKGPRYAKNLSYQTDSHGLAHSAGKTRNHNFILHMQYVLHCTTLYFFCWLISIGTLFWATAWALIKNPRRELQGKSSCSEPQVHVSCGHRSLMIFVRWHGRSDVLPLPLFLQMLRIKSIRVLLSYLVWRYLKRILSLNRCSKPRLQLILLQYRRHSRLYLALSCFVQVCWSWISRFCTAGIWPHCKSRPRAGSVPVQSRLVPIWPWSIS